MKTLSVVLLLVVTLAQINAYDDIVPEGSNDASDVTWNDLPSSNEGALPTAFDEAADLVANPGKEKIVKEKAKVLARQKSVKQARTAEASAQNAAKKAAQQRAKANHKRSKEERRLAEVQEKRVLKADEQKVKAQKVKFASKKNKLKKQKTHETHKFQHSEQDSKEKGIKLKKHGVHTSSTNKAKGQWADDIDSLPTPPLL